MPWRRARFSAELVDDDLIAVTDLRGAKSVAKDIEVVVRRIGEFTDIGKRQIICGGTNGRWDGVLVINSEFRKFIALGARGCDAAIDDARALIASRRWK